jgi:pseudaminic acid cytidylyltransferase
MNVAVIPARGGSKRIPRKNVRAFAGKPMIAHSIECAKESGVFDRIIVSTDDEEISRISRDYGAEVPFVRPKELSDDYANTTDVMSHAVGWLEGKGIAASGVCCIYATAPFIRSEDVKNGLAILETGRWAYVFSATTFPAPVFRSFQKNADGGIEMLFPQHYASRSQDLPEALHDAGQFYWARPRTWLDGAAIFGINSTVISIPRWRVQDIDTEEDWVRAEAMTGYLV